MEEKSPAFAGLFYSPGWTRTNNPPVNSRMLCQLSYRGRQRHDSSQGLREGPARRGSAQVDTRPGEGGLERLEPGGVVGRGSRLVWVVPVPLHGRRELVGELRPRDAGPVERDHGHPKHAALPRLVEDELP